MKKFISFTMALFVFISLLAGCGGSTVSSTAPQDTAASTGSGNAESSPADVKGEITQWTWYADWLTKWAEDFNKVYPNVKVNIITYSYDDYFAKLKTALSGGGGAPDIIELEDGQIAWLVECGQLEDLSKAPYNVDSSLFVDYEIPAFTNSEGELVALPEATGPAGIWYNRKVCNQYLGTDDPAEISKMIGSGEPGYSKFVDTMKTVVEKSGGKVKGVAALQDIYKMMLAQKGKGYFEGNKIVFEQLYKDDFAVLEEVARAGLSAKLAPEASDPWLASFTNDSVAFFPGACWYKGYYIADDDANKGKWGMVIPPVSGFDQGSQGTAMWKDSKNKEAAWAWLQWYNMSDEGQIAQWNVSAVPPALKSAYGRPEMQTVDGLTGQKLGQLFGEITKSAPKRIRTKDDSAVFDQVLQALLLMEDGKINADAALKQVVDEALKRLKDFSR